MVQPQLSAPSVSSVLLGKGRGQVERGSNSILQPCNFSWQAEYKDPEGRFILVKGLIDGYLFSFISYYAPNKGVNIHFSNNDVNS